MRDERRLRDSIQNHPGGLLTTIYSFCSKGKCADGQVPRAGLIQAANGNLYGTTDPYPYFGTVFSWSFTVLAPTFAPTSLTFASQPVNTTSPAKTITVKNPNADALTIFSITASAGFAVSSNTCGSALAGGKSCSIQVTFTPTQLGKIVGTLTVADSAANSPQKISLSGTGVEPVTLTPSSVIYSAQKVGTTSAPKVFTLKNNQSSTLNSIVISTTGDFAMSATTCTATLTANSHCTISVTFTPKATGTRKGQLSVHDSATNSPQISNLTGTGQ